MDLRVVCIDWGLGLMLVVLLIEASSRIDLVPNWCVRLLIEMAIGLIDLIDPVIGIEGIVTVVDVGFVGVGSEEVVHDWELVETCLEVVEFDLGVCLGNSLVEVVVDLIEVDSLVVEVEERNV